MRALLLLAAFLIEVWALVALGLGGRGLVDGSTGWLLGALFVVIGIAAWARWAAPRARTRLAGRRLFAFKMAFFAVVAIVLAVGGAIGHAVVLLVVASATVATSQALSVDAIDVVKHERG